jgi:CRISPR-associated protein Csy3
LTEVSLRFARNIANGRWLWRNRVEAQQVMVKVSAGGNEFEFDALDASLPLNQFDNYSASELKLAETIKAGLLGGRDALIRVRGICDMGVVGPVEVFASQNYLAEKEKGFARSLYHVGEAASERGEHDMLMLGQAALRDQKIGNALRTFDTWYPGYKERRIANPIEPNGASLDAQRFFRGRSGKVDTTAFGLMRRIDQIDPKSDDEKFLLACIIRGGVYYDAGDKSAEDKK